MLTCFLCQNKLDCVENLISHLRELHMLTDTSNCMCNICFIYVPFIHYGQHIHVHIGNRNFPFSLNSKDYLNQGHIPSELELACKTPKDTHLLDLLKTITENDTNLTDCVFKLCEECNIQSQHLPHMKKHHLKILFPRSELGHFIEFEKLLFKWQENIEKPVNVEEIPKIQIVESLQNNSFIENVVEDPIFSHGIQAEQMDQSCESFSFDVYESTEDSQDYFSPVNRKPNSKNKQQKKKTVAMTSTERSRLCRERRKANMHLYKQGTNTSEGSSTSAVGLEGGPHTNILPQEGNARMIIIPKKPVRTAKTSTERARLCRERKKAKLLQAQSSGGEGSIKHIFLPKNTPPKSSREIQNAGNQLSQNDSDKQSSDNELIKNEPLDKSINDLEEQGHESLISANLEIKCEQDLVLDMNDQN